MEKAKTFAAILGLGITIGVVLVVFLVFVLGARPTKVNVGGVEFEIPTSMPATQIIPLTKVPAISPSPVLVLPSLLPTSTVASPPTPIPNNCLSSHLGAGKQFGITLQSDCYYHFNIACNGCVAGQENNYVVYYSGNPIQVIVPEGSVWQYSSEPTINQVFSDCAASSMDFWPAQLPSFLNISGVRQIWPCGVK